MGQAQFGILGTLEVRVAELPLRLSAAQLRRLASSLVLTPGRPVRHDVLVEQLWPGDGPEARPQDPLATLRVYASRLRKLLPAGTGPHVDVNGYRITLDKGDVDAERFEAKVTASAEHLPHDPGGAAAALHEALGLWRGPALLEFRDETWAQGTAASTSCARWRRSASTRCSWRSESTGGCAPSWKRWSRWTRSANGPGRS